MLVNAAVVCVMQLSTVRREELLKRADD